MLTLPCEQHIVSSRLEDPTQQWEFQRKLKNYFWCPGSPVQSPLTIVPGRHGWCVEREIDPFSAPLASVLNFLARMFTEGYYYRTINVHRSAISSVLPHIGGMPVGQVPLVKLLFRDILQKNPPLPKYQFTWDLDLVIHYLNKLPRNAQTGINQVNCFIFGVVFFK